MIKKIKKIRSYRGLSAEDMAEKLDISFELYMGIESGSDIMRLNMLLSIAHVLSVSPSYFLQSGTMDIAGFNDEELLLELLFRKQIDRSYLVFHHKLTKLRQYRGFTHIQIAKDLKIKPHIYGAIERGQHSPTMNVYHKLCEYMNVHPNFLLHDDLVELNQYSDNELLDELQLRSKIQDLELRVI